MTLFLTHKSTERDHYLFLSVYRWSQLLYKRETTTQQFKLIAINITLNMVKLWSTRQVNFIGWKIDAHRITLLFNTQTLLVQFEILD